MQNVYSMVTWVVTQHHPCRMLRSAQTWEALVICYRSFNLPVSVLTFLGKLTYFFLFPFNSSFSVRLKNAFERKVVETPRQVDYENVIWQWCTCDA